MKRDIFVASCLLLLSACSFAPKYTRPEMNIPTAYKEAGKWIPASPNYATENRGPWWTVYHDPILNKLEDQVNIGNQNIAAAVARYDEARALVAVARSNLFPTITGVADVQRLRNSNTVKNPTTYLQYNDMLVGADLSYEIDVWGRIRNQVSAAESRARASAADLATINLSMQAELATDYFNLRGADEAERVLKETVIAYQKAYSLTLHRHQGGVASESDVDQAKAQLESAKTMATETLLIRAKLEHAIAVLMGEAPAQFSLAVNLQAIRIISIAPNVPSTLLQRRPDIASAELQVEAANAEIGVARAAYFPDFSLLGTLGLESATGYTLFEAPSLFWSLGPSAALYLFDGGRVTAFVNLAKARYFETVANYRQTTLTAFQEVEDNLVAIHKLNSEMQTQSAATKAAYRGLAQARYRYLGGIITYLEVVLSENIALQAQLSNIDIRTRRHVASVQLIKALGGGWERFAK